MCDPGVLCHKKWNSELVSVGNEGALCVQSAFVHGVMVNSILSLHHAASFGAWYHQRKSE